MVFSYSGLDLYRYNLLAQEWNLDFVQLRPGKFSANISQFISPNFQIGHTSFNCAVKQEGRSPEGVWTFAFANNVNIYWRNYIVHPKSIIIYAPGSEINAVSAANFDVMVFSISESQLLSIAKKEHRENLIHRLKSIELFSTHDAQWDVLRNSIARGLNSLSQTSNSKIRANFMNNFTKGLIRLMQGAEISVDKVSGKKRLKLLQAAEAIMLNNLTEHISVADVSRQLNVSERTLLYAFKNQFDMGPKAYMKVLKLNHAHHLLHRGIGSDTISAIARESGFWHMGQFHTDYKRFFGELPSDTVNSAEEDIK